MRVFKRVCVSVCCFYFPSFLGCKGAFLGRQGSGKTPLEDQRDSRQHPEGNVIQRSSRRKARMQQKKKEAKKSSWKISPPCTAVSPRTMRSDPPTSPRCAVYARRSGSSILSGRHQTDPGRERTMVAAATETVQLQQTTVTGGKKIKKKKNLLRGLLQKESSRNNTPPARGEEEKKNEMKKVRFPPPLLFFFFSFQTIKGTPCRPLRSTFPAVPSTYP